VGNCRNQLFANAVAVHRGHRARLIWNLAELSGDLYCITGVVHIGSDLDRLLRFRLTIVSAYRDRCGSQQRVPLSGEDRLLSVALESIGLQNVTLRQLGDFRKRELKEPELGALRRTFAESLTNHIPARHFETEDFHARRLGRDAAELQGPRERRH
jgi:hypothetical protein